MKSVSDVHPVWHLPASCRFQHTRSMGDAAHCACFRCAVRLAFGLRFPCRPSSSSVSPRYSDSDWEHCSIQHIRNPSRAKHGNASPGGPPTPLELHSIRLLESRRAFGLLLPQLLRGAFFPSHSARLIISVPSAASPAGRLPAMKAKAYLIERGLR